MEIILKGGPFDGHKITTGERDAFFTLDGECYVVTRETDQAGRPIFKYAPKGG
jgi:hypothetical protein